MYVVPTSLPGAYYILVLMFKIEDSCSSVLVSVGRVR